MKKLIKIIILFSIVFALVSCNDPIFFIVSEENPILKPFIDGSPTNFVEYNGELYAASGKQIYSYNGNKWSKWKNLNGRVVGLATADSSLYALYLFKDGGDGRIKNCNSGSDLDLKNVQSIHASNDVLFYCVRNVGNDNKIDYTIFYMDSSWIFRNIANSNSELRGVAFDGTYYYLCVNEGIYYVEKSQIDDPDTLPVLGKDNGFTGIIELKNNYIAAITNDGKLYEINNDVANNQVNIREAAKFSDSYSTGALALWYRNDNTMPSLLLVGRKEIYYSTSSAYTNGYVEITLNTTTGGILGSEFNAPGRTSPSSIDNYERYVSSLGKKTINHIIQTPKSIDPKMTLFASTQQDGVWSYRDRGKGELWNAEQNN